MARLAKDIVDQEKTIVVDCIRRGVHNIHCTELVRKVITYMLFEVMPEKVRL